MSSSEEDAVAKKDALQNLRYTLSRRMEMKRCIDPKSAMASALDIEIAEIKREIEKLVYSVDRL